MITEITGKCAYEGCNKLATHIACGRDWDKTGHPNVACYCSHHANIVSDERSPEYIVDCPNCGCAFGVN